ncbi:oxidoreductase [Burkholderia sp. PAMC 26561]|uniref:oxidoreductase n=1 Tax=Burkholderia sp. PAMC 26561 TaxID=1795043 RepID=UPI00076B2663|nr:oxidoreductase [Burkholderia sp. PAMC 26561]AME26994.1 short-chain dehydrogenase [Burkholderia sp. PAMC 26561]AME27861.1 short-chain dehydrogenase [Burkholderia sp. PAMC 26561]
MSRPVWLITGCSSGLGYALASAALRHGNRVVLTARNTVALEGLLSAYPETALVASLDVTKGNDIERVVREAEARFGAIDVLVNNAGVGYLAAVEEGSEDDIRWQFDTNFFGAANLIRAVLPGMRRHRQGTIINISSMAGVVSYAGMGYYAASKFALEGLTEALWQEVEPLGIRVMLVEPGGFRTGIVQRNRMSEQIEAYADTAGAFRQFVSSAGESVYPGDPEKAAKVIIDMVAADNKPHRLILGSDAYPAIVASLDAQQSEYAEYEAVSRSTDFNG